MPVVITLRTPAAQIVTTTAVIGGRTGRRYRVVSVNDHVHRGEGHAADRAVDVHGETDEDLDVLADVFNDLGYRVLWRVPGHRGHAHVEAPRAD